MIGVAIAGKGVEKIGVTSKKNTYTVTLSSFDDEKKLNKTGNVTEIENFDNIFSFTYLFPRFYMTMFS